MNSKEEKQTYKIRDEKGTEYVNNFKIVELNMDKFQETCYDETEEKYLKMLNLKGKELKNLARKDERVERFMEELERVNSDPIFREFMSEERDRELRFNTRLKKAEKRGLEQGVEQSKKDSARKMYDKGMDYSLICEVLEISEEQLNAYLDKN